MRTPPFDDQSYLEQNSNASSASSDPARKRQRLYQPEEDQANNPFWFPIFPAPKRQNTGRKSTAQPRPVLRIPPRGIGPIDEPNVHDVLCGRGGRINYHSGNIQFRDLVQSRKALYLAPSTKKLQKAHIAATIVEEIRARGGRFLKEDAGTGLWWDIGDHRAIKKSGQALREDAPELRHQHQEMGHADDNNIESAGSSPNSSLRDATQSGSSMFEVQDLLL